MRYNIFDPNTLSFQVCFCIRQQSYGSFIVLYVRLVYERSKSGQFFIALSSGLYRKLHLQNLAFAEALDGSNLSKLSTHEPVMREKNHGRAGIQTCVSWCKNILEKTKYSGQIYYSTFWGHLAQYWYWLRLGWTLEHAKVLPMCCLPRSWQLR